MTDDNDLYPVRTPGSEDLPKTVAEARQFMDNLTVDRSSPPVADLPPLNGEIMVVRSIRLPTSLELRAKAIATARGLPTSEVLREWIADGLERAEAGEQRDPVTDLRRIADAANHALRTLEGRRSAA
jgi:predicted DNA-binding protein